jgi:phosphotriesterase-related protein
VRRSPLSGAVTTVLGDISAAELGRCLPHEHLVCDFSPVTGDLDHVLAEVELATDELAPFRAAGGRAVVEVTPPDLGRDPRRLAEISRRSGVHVVMGTGWYRRAFYPEHLDRTPTAAVAEAMVVELTEGVDGVRAGVIGEIGCDGGHLTGVEERVLRAAGRAARTTGTLVTTHASMHPVGLAQLDVLAEEDVDPARVVVGHCDSHLDRDYHLALLRHGAWVEFDTAGRQHMNPDRRRARALVELVREGWLHRLLVSSDRCFRSDLTAFGGVGYAHVLTGFREELRACGLSDDEFDVLTVDNPAVALAR